MTVSNDTKMKQIRTIYDLLDLRPRIQYKEVAEALGVDARTASNRMKEAIEKEYIVGPQIRKKSFSNFPTYVYLIDFHDPFGLFEELVENEGVIYHAVLDGFCNLLVVAGQKLNIEGTLLQGVSSDYYITHAPDQTWQASIGNMWAMVEQFNPADYIPKGYITTHWDETAEWGEEDELLYQEFKYDLRKPLEPIVKQKYHMWSGNAISWLERLPEFCTVLTSFYPESLDAYRNYLYVFETEYEDFIIDLFSQLSTTCWFQKVSDRLIAHLWTLARLIKQENPRARNITGLQIPLLIRELVKRGIIRSETHAVFKCYWRKEFDE